MLAGGTDSGGLVDGLRDRMLAAFPGQIQSLYLLGSRALGCQIGTSDVDLAVLFQGEAGPERRRALAHWVEGARAAGGPMMDVTVLDARDLARGTRPHLRIARLLAGEDVVKDLPLKPAATLLGYYAHLALYFIWAVRGRPAGLRHPLEYPSAEGDFRGYEHYGVRIGENRYVPGFAQLVNDVNCLAAFRLAHRAGEYIPNKSMTVAAFARLFPADPRLDLVRGVFELGRTRWQGQIPPVAADRERLADYCRRVLDWENETLADCLLLLPGLAALEDPEIRQRTRSIVERVSSSSPAQAAAIAKARDLLRP